MKTVRTWLPGTLYTKALRRAKQYGRTFEEHLTDIIRRDLSGDLLKPVPSTNERNKKAL